MITICVGLVHNSFTAKCWFFVTMSLTHLGNIVLATQITMYPRRFPNGIKHLADFVHKHGMKLGIYGAVGPTTCMRFPGNAGHIEQDALQYAEWGVDMFKFDGCFVPLDRLKVRDVRLFWFSY